MDGSQYRLMPPYGGSGALYLGLQENNKIVIPVNTVIMGTCRGFWLSRIAVILHQGRDYWRIVYSNKHSEASLTPTWLSS